MTPTILGTSFPAQPHVRFKRCPDCGDVTIMSAPICGCCDRTFVTTARFVRQVGYQSLIASIVPNPYLYDNQADFAVVKPTAKTKGGVMQASPIAVPAAAVGLAWLGMILNGQKAKGVVMLMASIVFIVCGLLVALESRTLMLFTSVAAVGAYLVGLVDVILISSRIKSQEIVREWDWF